MDKYLYNDSKTDGRFHEVHTEDCSHLPLKKNQVKLGSFANCRNAIREAERLTGDHDFDGCHYCCNDCHTG